MSLNLPRVAPERRADNSSLYNGDIRHQLSTHTACFLQGQKEADYQGFLCPSSFAGVFLSFFKKLLRNLNMVG